MSLVCVAIGSADVSCFLAHHDCQSVRLLADTLCCAVPEAKLLGYVKVVTDGQDAGGGSHPSSRYYHCSVVQGTVFEEYVLYQSLADLGVNQFASPDEVVQREVVLHDDKCANLLLAHVQTSHHYGEYALSVVYKLGVFLMPLWAEYGQYASCLTASSDAVEEMAYLFLEEYDDGNGSHAHQLVQYVAQQLHLQYFADDYPEAYEQQDTIEDVHRTRLLHQLVAVVQDHGYQYDVYDILYPYVKHADRVFLTMLTVSTASLTSWTLRMEAPFIRAMVLRAVVPFRASAGVVPERR